MPPVEGSGPTRRDPGWLLVLAVVLLAARVAVTVYEHGHPPKVVERIAWRPIETAESEARASDRPILYDFSAEWCGPCQRMSREVFADRAHATQIESQFVPVRVLDRAREDGHNSPAVAELQALYEVTAFPTLVVVSPDGARHETIVGYPGVDPLTNQLMQARFKVQGSRMFRFGGTFGRPDSARRDSIPPRRR